VLTSSVKILMLLLLWPMAAIAANFSAAIVFPLDGPGGNPSMRWLSEGIAISISDQLESRELKAIDRSERVRLVENLDLPPGAQLSRASMIRVAQRAKADFIVMGSYSGAEKNLRISVRVFDVKALKLGGEMVANGPLSAIPQMENELAWLILSNNSLEQGSSRAKFQERARKVPNQAYAYYVQSFEASGESEQFRLLLKAIQTHRDFPDAQFQLGKLYFQNEDCGNALRHLTFVSTKKGMQADSDFMRGTCYLQGGQDLLSIQAFQRLLQVSRSFEALNNLGVAYLRQGDFALAQNALVEANSLARMDPTVSLNHAIIRHLQGSDVAARSILEEASKAHPKNGLLQFLMGIVLKAQGENDKAVLATAKAKSLGINVEKLQSEDPKTWSRVFSSLESLQE
jgi:tetratricopeptide (TPR) repeat protein